EFRKVKNTLVGEVVIKRSVGRNDMPLRDEDRRFKCEKQKHGEHTPWAVHVAANSPIERSEKAVGIPRREADVREIEFRTTSGAPPPLRHQFLAESQVFFLRSFVPEVGFFHALGEEAYVFDCGGCSGPLLVDCCNLVVRSNAVKEQRQLPLKSWNAKEGSFLPLQYGEDRLAIEHVFANHELRINAGRTAARQARL